MHEVRISHRLLQVGDDPDPGYRFSSHCPGKEPGLQHGPLVFGDAGPGRPEGLLVASVQVHLVSGLGEELGNAAPHHPSPDQGNHLDLVYPHHLSALLSSSRGTFRQRLIEIGDCHRLVTLSAE